MIECLKYNVGAKALPFWHTTGKINSATRICLQILVAKCLQGGFADR